MKNVKESGKPLSIPSSTGRTIAIQNLRPGDWLGWLTKNDKHTGRDLVVSNSNGVIDTVFAGLEMHYPYQYLKESSLGFVYLGRGKKRKWLDKLPKCVSNLFCPYSGPRK